MDQHWDKCDTSMSAEIKTHRPRPGGNLRVLKDYVPTTWQQNNMRLESTRRRTIGDSTGWGLILSTDTGSARLGPLLSGHSYYSSLKSHFEEPRSTSRPRGQPARCGGAGTGSLPEQNPECNASVHRPEIRQWSDSEQRKATAGTLSLAVAAARGACGNRPEGPKRSRCAHWECHSGLAIARRPPPIPGRLKFQKSTLQSDLENSTNPTLG